MKVEQTKLEKSQIELFFELTKEEFDHYVEHALEHLKKHVKVDGFRPGQAPAKMVEDKINPETLLMEAGDHAVQHSYVDYVKESKLEPVGQPEVKIKKIAKGSSFEFTAVITVLPDVELPNYKEIAKSVKGQDISVTEDEVEESVRYLQKTRAKFTLKNAGAEKGDFVDITYQNKDVNGGKPVQDKFILGEGGFMPGFEDSIVGMKDGEEKTFKAKFPENLSNLPAGRQEKDLAGKEADFTVKVISVQKMEMPEINDEFAKQLGAFDTLVALKEDIKTGITAEKTEAEKQRRRAEILEKIAEKSKFEMPEAMVNYEKERLLEDLKNKISSQLKIKFEEYLATIKKTEDEVKETYQREAEKRLKGFLILRQLGKQESVEVSEKEIEEELEKHAGHNHGNPFDTAQGKIDREQLKEYTKGVLFNEKVFKLLEN